MMTSWYLLAPITCLTLVLASNPVLAQEPAEEASLSPLAAQWARQWESDELFPEAAIRAAAFQELELLPIEDPAVISGLDRGSSSQLVESFEMPVFDPSMNSATGDFGSFYGNFTNDASSMQIGLDLYSPPTFDDGLIIFGPNVAMKVGGYVKADFIYDFDPIDTTDSFVTTTIPVSAPPRTNARFHARQTRLSFDTRWTTNERPIRIYVEGDFFSDGNQFRLRQAYGEVGSLLVGQTWTTFTDVAASPATLDFEGSVSNVNRRQAQARYTRKIFRRDLTLALAVEDTDFIIEVPSGFTAAPRSPSPDFVAHLRLEREWGQTQIATLYRIVGVQPTGASVAIFRDEVVTANAWGIDWSGVVMLTDSTKAYSKIVFGEGIGSYRDLPDAAPTANDRLGLLPMFGWMVGMTHDWNDDLSSNFTYAENSLETSSAQVSTDVQRTTYLAMNLIWSPLERVSVGIEYLYGIRENVDGETGSANRLQSSVIFDLP